MTSNPKFDAYKAEATAKIRQSEAKMKELEAKLAEASEGTRKDCAALSDKAKHKLAEINSRLAEMKDDAGDKITEAKAYADAGLDEVERLYGEVKQKLSR